MNLKEIIPYIGTPDFRDRVQKAVEEQSYELPLERCLRYGGWPESDTLDVGEISECSIDDEEVILTIPVFFDESVPTSCQDIKLARFLRISIALLAM